LVFEVGRAQLTEASELVRIGVRVDPAVERVLRADRKALPSDLAVVELGLLAVARLVDDLVVRPSVLEHRQHLGEEVLPRVVEILAALLDEVSDLLRSVRLIGRSHLPRHVANEHLDRKEEGANDGVVVTHLTVDPDGLLSVKGGEELLGDPLSPAIQARTPKFGVVARHSEPR
jgi:hypothetical protein